MAAELIYLCNGLFQPVLYPVNYQVWMERFRFCFSVHHFTCSPICAVGFIGGSLAEKISPRKTIYLGLCLFAGGWFLTGFASSIPQLYIFYGLMAGAGGGLIYPACLPTALKWFP